MPDRVEGEERVGKRIGEQVRGVAGLRVRPQAVSYIAWSGLFAVSAVNAFAIYPVLSGAAGLIFSVVLGAVAAWLLARGFPVLPRKESQLAAVFLLLFATTQLVHWTTTLAAPPTNRGLDFSAYYLAGKETARGAGQRLYSLPLYPDGRMNLNAAAPAASAWAKAAVDHHAPFAAPFIYPPFLAVLMAPLARLPFGWALLLWKTSMVVLFAGGVVLSLGAGHGQIDRRTAILWATGLASFYPFVDSLALGQIDSLIFFLLAAGVWLLSRNHMASSSLCYAVATLIKLTPVAALPILVLYRRWKWLATYAGAAGALLGVSIWRAGWPAHWQFWHQVLPGIACGAPIGSNASLDAYVQELLLGRVPDWATAPLTLPAGACATSRAVSLAAYLLVLVRLAQRHLRGREAGRERQHLVRDLTLMVLLSIVVSPISWWHHYTIALLPWLLLWSRASAGADRFLLVFLAVVGTNLVGFSLLLVERHGVQLALAGAVPLLTLALLYRETGTRGESRSGVVLGL